MGYVIDKTNYALIDQNAWEAIDEVSFSFSSLSTNNTSMTASVYASNPIVALSGYASTIESGGYTEIKILANISSVSFVNYGTGTTAYGTLGLSVVSGTDWENNSSFCGQMLKMALSQHGSSYTFTGANIVASKVLMLARQDISSDGTDLTNAYRWIALNNANTSTSSGGLLSALKVSVFGQYLKNGAMSGTIGIYGRKNEIA